MSVLHGPICFICGSSTLCSHREPELVEHFGIAHYSLSDALISKSAPEPWWPPKQRSTSQRGRKGASYG